MALRNNREKLDTYVINGEIAILTHYWYDERFPTYRTVTKVGCNDLEKLYSWGIQYDLLKKYIDRHPLYPHYDLFGEKQLEILINERQWDQIKRFDLKK